MTENKNLKPRKSTYGKDWKKENCIKCGTLTDYFAIPLCDTCLKAKVAEKGED